MQILRNLRFLALVIAVLLSSASFGASDEPALFPLSDVQPGMKGYMNTIFSGDTIERVDLEVIGVMHNAIGPKQDVILVRLLGDKVAQTGVVSGMSGSPVYFDGKLAGALSLKMGTFTREAIGGVTPIDEMLEVQKASDAAALPTQEPAANTNSAWPAQTAVPQSFAQQVGAAGSQMLIPIETPIISAGLYPEALSQFGKFFSSWGMSMAAGGSAAPSPSDHDIKPGDMVGVDLIRGDFSISAGCTVTTVQAGKLLACGHPIFGFGPVTMAMSRAHVLLTLASPLASTKIIDTGSVIGTLTEDRQTAVMGKLGAGPPMIPVHLTVDSAAGHRQYSFEVIPSPQLTPQLVSLSAYNGIAITPDFGGGKTLELNGTIDIKDHSTVRLSNTFGSAETSTQTGMAAALSVQTAFTEIYSNPYEIPQIKSVDLHIKESPERRISTISSAWTETTEAHPGDTVNVKVLLRPYRGAPFVQEIPVTIPQQTALGTVALIVSDAAYLNRSVQLAASASQGKLAGLEELVGLVNRERRNDSLYATLVQSTPSLLVNENEMPNIPVSALNVFDERPNTGSTRLQIQSMAGEWSVPMNQVISGQQVLTLTIR